MSILKKLLGLGGLDTPPSGASPPGGAGDTETVRKIVARLEALSPERARFLAAFAYTLARAAHADLQIHPEEIAAMERIVREVGGLPEDQAVLVVQIAKSQALLFGGTENFLVTREFRDLSDDAQRRRLLDCLFAVSAADGGISGAEESQVRQVASELGFSHAEYVDARSAWNDHREVLRGLRPPVTS